MENHPIPQDVTGFKFKIIGSMTVKQFAYVVAAGIFCTITFVSPLHFLLKYPLMIIFGLIGVALAFVPVGGRPLDKMLIYFARSVPRENQFVYRKKGIDLSQYEFLKPPKTVQQPQQPQQAPQQSKDTAKRQALASALRNSYFRPDNQEMQYFASLKASFDNPGTAIVTPTPLANETKKVMPVRIQPVIKEQEVVNPVKPVLPQVSEEEIKQKMAQTEVVKPVASPTPKAADEVAEIKKEIQDIRTYEQTAGYTAELEQKVRDLEQKLAESLGQTASYQQKVLQQAKQVSQATPVTPTQKEAPKANTVKTITPQSNLTSGFPSLPDIPNIVLGIIKDPRGKVLQNILVEVVDTNEIPVRAFKTNALGQFISATPLPNGTYKIYFDDPGKNHEFETVQVEMKGEIFNPLEITSIDQREKLRRDLFGNMAAPTQSPVSTV